MCIRDRLEALSLMNGSPANNTYRMVVVNNNPTNTGILEQWGLNICGATTVCAPLRIPDAIRFYNADLACKDGEGWTHYSISAGKNPLGNYDLMIMSLKLNDGDEILPEDVSIRIPTTSLITKINNAQYINDPTDWAVMNRHWIMSPSIQPSGLTGVRFYFSEKEVNALFTNAGLNDDYDSLKVFSIYSNGILNPNLVSKHVTFLPTDVKLHDASFGDYNIRKYAEFYTNYLEDGCIGAGGQFKAVSSTKKDLNSIAFGIYPNPANNELNLSFNASIAYDYTIYDVLGKQLLFGKKSKLNNSFIDVSQLNPGTYIIKINSNEESTAQKFEILK